MAKTEQVTIDGELFSVIYVGEYRPKLDNTVSKSITIPKDWVRYIEDRAKVEGMNFSAMLLSLVETGIPVSERKELSVRRGRGRLSQKGG